MTERRSELSQFKPAIASLAERVLAVDIRAYESMPPDRLASELQPIVAEVLAAATTLVGAILAAYELANRESRQPTSDDVTGGLTSPYLAFEQAIDAAIDAQNASSLEAVGAIAFLAQLELRQRAERLERVTACRSVIAIVGECDSALRRVRKALTSIDVALARAGFGEPSFDFASELELSLRVRRACAKLRSRVLAGGDPTPDTLNAKLRSAGTAIAMLVGWEIYPSLRVRDRLQLRDVQRRILDWLRSDRDATAGMRLWQDLVTFIRMLSQVNRRQELLEHDTRVARDLRAALRSSDDETIDEATRALLASLEGLDEELDALLVSTDASTRSALRSAVERIAASLAGPEANR